MHSESQRQHGHHGHLVKVSIDGRQVEISQGSYIVSELKAKLNVPADYELEHVEHGQFKPLDDNERIEIRHHEEFVSHVRCGASS